MIVQSFSSNISESEYGYSEEESQIFGKSFRFSDHGREKRRNGDGSGSEYGYSDSGNSSGVGRDFRNVQHR